MRNENLRVLDSFAKLSGEATARPSHHLRTLRRRIEFLSERIASGGASPGAMNHLLQERSALNWAMDKLKRETPQPSEQPKCAGAGREHVEGNEEVAGRACGDVISA